MTEERLLNCSKLWCVFLLYVYFYFFVIHHQIYGTTLVVEWNMWMNVCDLMMVDIAIHECVLYAVQYKYVERFFD